MGRTDISLIGTLPRVLFTACLFLLAGCGVKDDEAVTGLVRLSGIKAAMAEEQGTIVVPGQGPWLFLASELRHVGLGVFWGGRASEVSRSIQAEHADPLPAIVEFHHQLESVGVELLLVPVPPKVSIYPDALDSSFFRPTRRLDRALEAFYALLRKEGVAVLDITEALLDARQVDERPFYLQQDSHWAGPAVILAARKLADEIRTKPWFESLPTHELSIEERTLEVSGDLWNAVPKPKPIKERVTLRFVGIRQGNDLTPLQPDATSPVLLLTDSHGLVFHAGDDMHAVGAGIVDQLSYELGYPVDLIAVRGSAATPVRLNLLRKSRKDGTYLARKKLVVWLFAAREFSESAGWRKLPPFS